MALRTLSAPGDDELVMTPSPTVAALRFAAAFHQDVKSCGTNVQQLVRVHCEYRDKILALQGFSINIAAAFQPLLCATQLDTQSEVDVRRWDEFNALAKRASNMRDRANQKLRHEAAIVAAWGLDVFQHYSWSDFPGDTQRRLHDLAALLPRWRDAVLVLNRFMLARHELRVVGGSNTHKRIGEHSTSSCVQAEHSPVERKDIFDALNWVRKQGGPVEARIGQIRSLTNEIGDTPIRDFGLERDRYGMVVPSPGAAADDVSDQDLPPQPAAVEDVADGGSSPTPAIVRPCSDVPQRAGVFRSWSSRRITTTEVSSLSPVATPPGSPHGDGSLKTSRVFQRHKSSPNAAENDADQPHKVHASGFEQAIDEIEDDDEHETNNVVPEIVETGRRKIRSTVLRSAKFGQRKQRSVVVAQEQETPDDAGDALSLASSTRKTFSQHEQKRANAPQVSSGQQTTRKRKRAVSPPRERGLVETMQPISPPFKSSEVMSRSRARRDSSSIQPTERSHSSSLVPGDRESSWGESVNNSTRSPINIDSSNDTDSNDEMHSDSEADGDETVGSAVGDAVYVQDLVTEAVDVCEQGEEEQNCSPQSTSGKQLRLRGETEDPVTSHAAEVNINDESVEVHPGHYVRRNPNVPMAEGNEDSNKQAGDDLGSSDRSASEGADGNHGSIVAAGAAANIRPRSQSTPSAPPRDENQIDNSILDRSTRVAQNADQDTTSSGSSIDGDELNRKTPGSANPNAEMECAAPPDGDSLSLTMAGRPSTLLHALQARHLHMVEEWSSKFKASKPDAPDEELRILKSHWLNAQTWASIYAEPESVLGLSSVSADEADVWYLSWECFQSYAVRGYVFNRPVVIKQKFQDSGMYNIDEYMHQLWQRFPDRSIDVQDSRTGVCSKQSVPEFCLAVSKTDLSSADECAPISNAINLGRLAQADEPLLTRLGRFRMLSVLIDRFHGVVGKKQQREPSDVEGSFGFNLLSFTGAFSRPHLDYLVGTWVRCLVGCKIWVIVPGMVQDDWESFAREGCNWSPGDKARILILEEDDVLLMPPGLRTVHAVFSPKPCLMEGGMLWDECSLPEILEGLLWIARNQACTNEVIAYQLPAVIDMLEQWVSQNGTQSSLEPEDVLYWREVGAGIARLRELGCTCPHGCERAKACPCKQQERRCTAWCRDHPRLPPQIFNQVHTGDGNSVNDGSNKKQTSSSTNRKELRLHKKFRCMLEE
jgi:hypothetical protein